MNGWMDAQKKKRKEQARGTESCQHVTFACFSFLSSLSLFFFQSKSIDSAPPLASQGPQDTRSARDLLRQQDNLTHGPPQLQSRLAGEAISCINQSDPSFGPSSTAGPSSGRPFPGQLYGASISLVVPTTLKASSCRLRYHRLDLLFHSNTTASKDKPFFKINRIICLRFLTGSYAKRFLSDSWSP